MNELTLKQQRFADEYIRTGNAYKSAILAGYSKNYAKGQVNKLLENVGVKAYIDKRLEELKKKAKNGDNFATQFTSIFVPYKDENEAKQIYPEYFELLSERLEGEKVYFYHCPKLTKENRCSDYENRPGICRDFPDNPLGFLPGPCGFQE